MEWALGLGKTSIVTTNFRPFEAVILHMVTQVNPKVPVVWMDNGYNTEATYRFADEGDQAAGLNLKIYLPLRSRAHREAVEGPTPALDDPRHAAFTAEVKLRPFARALRETAPRSGSPPCVPPTPPCVQTDGPREHQPRRAHQGWRRCCTGRQRPARVLREARPANNFDYVDPTRVKTTASAACTSPTDPQARP